MARSNGGLAEAHELQKEAIRVWEALIRLSYMSERLEKAGMKMGSITLRPPASEGSDWLGIVRMSMQDAPYVGFISGREIGAVLNSMVAKLENGSMAWKEDKYANA
jgi:hypothetical protein